MTWRSQYNQENTPDRLGRILASRLNQACDGLDHSIQARLAHARRMAMERARQRRRVARDTLSHPSTDWRSASISSRGSSLGQKLAAALPLALLLTGLWIIDDFRQFEQVQAAAKMDSELLADELPPQAYADPGFMEFLRRGTGK